MNNENKELEVSSQGTSAIPDNSTLNSTVPVSSSTPVINSPISQGNSTSSVSAVTPMTPPQTPVLPTGVNTPIINATAVPSGVPEPEKKKSGSKIVIVIVMILLIAMIAVGIYFFCFKDKDKDINSNSTSNTSSNNEDVKNSNTNQNVSGNVMTLEELSQSFNNLSSIKKYNEIDGYSIESSVEGKKFVITVNLSEKLAGGGPTETKIEGILEENILTFKATGDTNEVMSTTMMSVLVLTAKATKDGISENDASTVFSGDPVGKLEENGYEISSTQTSIECKIDLSKKIVLPDLSDRYITEDDLDFIDDILEYKSGSLNGHVGMMHYYFKMSSITNETTILVAEKNEFTDKSYQSILSFIKKTYGETELNNFQTQYKKVENKTFGKYTITLNPQLEDYQSYYNDGYVVVQIIVKD